MRIDTRIAAALLAALGNAAAAAAEDYRRFTPDEPLQEWRAANEAVRAAGGHAGMHGSQPPPAAPAKDTTAPAGAKPAVRKDGHAGHGHGGKP